MYYYLLGYFAVGERLYFFFFWYVIHIFYTLNCFKQSARYFLISESVPGINFRLRWVRCLNGFVSITFNVQVVRSPFKEPWEIKWRMNLQEKKHKNKWCTRWNTGKSMKFILKKNRSIILLDEKCWCVHTHIIGTQYYMYLSHIHSMNVDQLNWCLFFLSYHYFLSCN